MVLSELKLEQEKTIIGGLQDGEREKEREGGNYDFDLFLGGYYGKHEKGQRAFIDRYRYNMIEGLFNTLSHSPDAKIAMTEELPSFVSTLEDIYYLRENQRDKIKSAWIKRFESIAELQSNVRTIDDVPVENMMRVRINTVSLNLMQ